MVTKNALDGFKNKDHEIGSILSTLFNHKLMIHNLGKQMILYTA